MDAVIFRDRGEYFFSLRIAGEEIDVAGPFDDEHDAMLAAQRSADTVQPLSGLPGVVSMQFNPGKNSW